MSGVELGLSGAYSITITYLSLFLMWEKMNNLYCSMNTSSYLKRHVRYDIDDAIYLFTNVYPRVEMIF